METGNTHPFDEYIYNTYVCVYIYIYIYIHTHIYTHNEMVYTKTIFFKLFYDM